MQRVCSKQATVLQRSIGYSIVDCEFVEAAGFRYWVMVRLGLVGVGVAFVGPPVAAGKIINDSFVVVVVVVVEWPLSSALSS